MRSRSKELIDRAVSAMMAAIEIYNKPNFEYRDETFSILCVNAWELAIKAKWLSDHDNKLNCLYVMQPVKKRDGTDSKRSAPKPTRSGNPMTHSLDYIAKKLVESKKLDPIAWANLQLLLEVRDSAIHFYNFDNIFSMRLQEIGAASLRNFAYMLEDWFAYDLSGFNFYLLPLGFIAPTSNSTVVLNAEERNFLAFLEQLEETPAHETSKCLVSVGIDVHFVRSKTKDSLEFRVTNNPNAREIRLSEEQLKDRYPWTYERLNQECRSRYTDFKIVKKYHDLRKPLHGNPKYCHERSLDPDNSKSPKTTWFAPAILNIFDKHYTKK
jgi:hypothetical protein